MVSYKVNDKIEAYIKADGRVWSFESQIVHLTSDDQVVVVWDRGSEVTPKMVHDGWPAHLEGLKVFRLHMDEQYYESGQGWGRVVRKVTSPKRKQQVHRYEPGGMLCMNCRKMTQYASANMNDGSFCCRNCRLYKSWMIPDDISYIGYEGERD